MLEKWLILVTCNQKFYTKSWKSQSIDDLCIILIILALHSDSFSCGNVILYYSELHQMFS